MAKIKCPYCKKKIEIDMGEYNGDEVYEVECPCGKDLKYTTTIEITHEVIEEEK